MTEVLPRPKAIDAVVFNDTGARTLHVRLSDEASGYDKLLWRQGWQLLRRAEETGWPEDGAPWVWADVPGGAGAVHGLPGEWGTLTFHFPPGTAGYSELTGKPGLVAIATVDIALHHILRVRFLNRPGRTVS